jgi:putative flavoprotein involved in K+ transport
MVAPVDVLVVGAGQAGVSAASELCRLGLTCTVHERHAHVGDSWRKRYDSLVLFTSREYSALPNLAHAGDPDGFPHRLEMADYLERYAAHRALPVVTGEGIERLSRSEHVFSAVTDQGKQLEARAVVLAAGAFQRSRVPGFAASLSERVLQRDATTYRSPSTLAAQNVVVVGDGATGRQIALELAATRRVALATGKRRNIVPQRLLGKDSTWWFDRAGLIRADKATPVGRWVRAMDSFPGWHLRSPALQRAGVTLLPRCVAASGDELEFGDGSRRACDAVIWALGYRDDLDWVDIRGATRDGAFAHDRGVTAMPGLFHVGREWQNSRASALICGVTHDAAKIAERVAEFLRHS